MPRSITSQRVAAVLVLLTLSTISVSQLAAAQGRKDVNTMGKAVPTFTAGCAFDGSLGLTANGGVGGLRTGAIQGVVIQWENVTSTARSGQDIPFNVDSKNATQTTSARTASTWVANFQLVATGGANGATNQSGDTISVDFKVYTAKGPIITNATCAIP